MSKEIEVAGTSPNDPWPRSGEEKLFVAASSRLYGSIGTAFTSAHNIITAPKKSPCYFLSSVGSAWKKLRPYKPRKG